MRNPFRAPTIARMFSEQSSSHVQDEEFFPYIRLANGTFKTTCANRFPDVDAWLADHLLQQKRHVDLLDCACSSGTGTMELAQALNVRGVDSTLYASDLSLQAHQHRLPLMSVLTTDPVHILQVDVAGCAFPNTPPSKLSGIVFTIARGIIRFQRALGLTGSRVRLLSLRARQSAIQFSEGDVFQDIYQADTNREFDVIRIANLLHTNYFSVAEIQRAIANVRGRLRPNGYLLLIRTEDDVNLASLFQRVENSFTNIGQLNGGIDLPAGLVESA